jgi:hypothetical protein
MMRNKEMDMSKIDFISANNGGIKMYFKNSLGKIDYAGWGTTAETIAEAMKKYGLADCVMGSSTMDFASEEGFKNDGDALLLWDDAIGIYNWEVNGIA